MKKCNCHLFAYSIVRVLTKKLKFELPNDISSDAKKFLTTLLEFDPSRRCSADEALKLSYLQLVKVKKEKLLEYLDKCKHWQI